jgi:hypothetical protein
MKNHWLCWCGDGCASGHQTECVRPTVYAVHDVETVYEIFSTRRKAEAFIKTCHSPERLGVMAYKLDRINAKPA